MEYDEARITLDRKTRRQLEDLVGDGNTAQKIAKRARIVVMTAQGHGVTAIMREVGVSKSTVRRWQDYFVEASVEGLVKGRSKPPGKKPISAAIKLEVVEKTVKERLANATHWSVRAMAQEMGISHTSVQRIWAEYGLKPHLVKNFKVSNDPAFAAKVEDIVGLYLDPPEKALVLSIDEKSQIQALDRTQPGLPLKKGRAGTMTHDYKRNGTTTLFAALDMATGKVIGECMPRHRADEFLAFLKKVDRETPAHLDLHLILDNYATHKTPSVKRWLARHKRFMLHFTPTSCSWLNMIERLFAEITRQRIRRGTFNNVAELETAITEWIEHRNQNPKPFIWAATAKSILVKHRRAKKALAQAKARDPNE
jgi:transposase